MCYGLNEVVAEGWMCPREMGGIGGSRSEFVIATINRGSGLTCGTGDVTGCWDWVVMAPWTTCNARTRVGEWTAPGVAAVAGHFTNTTGAFGRRNMKPPSAGSSDATFQSGLEGWAHLKTRD